MTLGLLTPLRNLICTTLVIAGTPSLALAAPRSLISGSTASQDATPDAPAAAGKLDLRATLTLALAISPNVETAVQQARAARLALTNARVAWFPTLDAQATHGYRDTGYHYGLLPAQVGLHGPWSNALALNVNENLYDNGETLRQAEIAAAQAESAEVAAVRGRMLTLRTAAKAFYDFSNAALGVDIQRAQIEALRKQFRIIDSRYRQGISSNRDFLRIKSQVESAEIDVISQQIGLEEQRVALRNAIGARDRLDFEPFRPDPAALDAIRFAKPDVDATYDFRIARAQDRASDLRVRSAERANLPRLTLRGSYAYTQPQYIGARDYNFEASMWDLQAMIVLDWTLWDWGTRRRGVEIADSQRRIEKAGREIQLVQTAQDLARLDANAGLLLRTYRESRQVVRDIESAFASVETAYREGKVTYIDLTQALGEVFSSRSRHISVQYNLLKAQADLGYYQGNLDELLGVR